MKPTGARADGGFDRLLRQELGREAAPPVPCPQVEMLAAWYDRSLPAGGAASRFASAADREEAAAIEAHLAACGRCRQVVASLARSAPEVLYVHPQPARVSWTWHLRWLAPVSAAAAILVVAVAGTQLFRTPAPIPMASGRATGEAISPSEAPAREVQGQVTVPAAPGAAAPSGVASRSPQKFALRDAPSIQVPTVQEGKTEQAAGKPDEAVGAADSAARSQLAGAGLALPPAGEKDKKPAPAPSDTRLLTQAGAARAEAEAAAPPAAPSAVPAPVPAPLAPAPAPSRQAGIRVRATASRETVAWAFVRGSDVGWRPGGPGLVYRTDDGGRSVARQALPDAASLTRLSAVSPSVCWGAGPAGVLAKTTDGATWRIVTPPAAADFVSLSAVSADSATVVTSDGTTYDTADGGRTWQRRQAP